MILDPYLKSYTKRRAKTVKLLEENIDSRLFDIGHSNIFLNLSLQARETKAKTNKWDYIRLKSFCTMKETINKMKRQIIELEKIFTNCISDKELISRICK